MYLDSANALINAAIEASLSYSVPAVCGKTARAKARRRAT